MKSRREEDHLEDLRETFDTLCSYNMKLNPGKFAIEVTVGKFLGFMVSQRGIEANPNKIRAIMEMALEEAKICQANYKMPHQNLVPNSKLMSLN